MKKSFDTQQQKITITFGYGLFGLAFIAILSSLAPWGPLSRQNFTVPPEVITTMVLFALTTILVPLTGYFIGDAATRKKSKLVHHYNGVHFGVLAFWVMTASIALITPLNYDWLRSALSYTFISDIIPEIIAVVILVICGLVYARHTKHQTPVLNYRPYRVLLIASFLVLFVTSGISIATSSWAGIDIVSSFAVLFLPVIMIGAVAIFGAWVIGAQNGTPATRLIKSLIALSYGLIAMTFVTQILMFNIALTSWSFVVGLVVWTAYIILLRRYPTLSK